MHIGQICKVRWQTQQGSDTFMWHNAMIKSIEGDTITVIWEKGQWEGCESDRIPLDWVIVQGDITSVKRDIDDVKNLVLHHIKIDNNHWEQCHKGIHEQNEIKWNEMYGTS